MDQETLAVEGADAACKDAGVPSEKPDNHFYQIIMDGDPAEFAIATYEELIERLNFYMMAYIPDEDDEDETEPPYIDVALHIFPGAAQEYRDHYANRIIDSNNVRKGVVKAPKKKKSAPKRLKSNARRNKT